MRRQRGGTLGSALRHREFRALIAGAAISDIGSWAYNVGLTVSVYDQTHSPAWAGLVTVGRMVPSVLFGSYGGVLAERFERVRLMITLDLLSAVLMGALAVETGLHGAPALTIAMAAAMSLMGRVYDPAAAALTPQLVPEDDLAAANTMRNTVSNVAVVAGPAIGALLLLAGSPMFAFVVNAASFVVSAGITATIGTRSQPVDVTEGGSAGLLRQVAVGMRTLASDTSTMLLVAYSVIASFVYGTDTVMFIVLSEHRLGTSANGYGLLLAGLGVGGVLAAGPVNRISARPRLAAAIIGGITLYCIPSLLLLVAPDPAVAFFVELVRGGGTLVVDVLAMTALQRSLPREKLARGLGAFFSLVLLAISLGALLTPVLLRATGITGALWVLGAGLPALCLLGWPKLARMDRANVAHLRLIGPRVALLQRAALLAEAPTSALERLAEASTEQSVAPGTDVVREGDEADALYVVEHGDLVVLAGARAGQGDELNRLSEGDYFGEIGLLDRIRRTATVRSVGQVELLRVDGAAFLDVLVDNPASTSLLEGAAARLARSAERARLGPG